MPVLSCPVLKHEPSKSTAVQQHYVRMPRERVLCSTVYLAKNVKTGALAAVKAVSSERVTQQKMLDSLFSEIKILEQVAHPSVVKLLENTWREVWGFALIYSVDTSALFSMPTAVAACWRSVE